jgi:hypothetical protein
MDKQYPDIEQKSRFEELMHQVLIESYSEQEHAEFEHLLLEYPILQQQYLQEIELHRGLQQLKDSTVARDSNGQIPFSMSELLAATRPNKKNRSNASSGSRRKQFSLLSLLSILCLCVGGYFLTSTKLAEMEAVDQQPYAAINIKSPAPSNTVPSNTVPSNTAMAATSDTAPAEVKPTLSSVDHTGKMPEATASKIVPSGATIVAKSQAKFLNPFQAVGVGDALAMNEDYILFKGMVELHFENGAEVIINSPAMFTVTDRSAMRVKLGQCSVYAPEGAEGFTITTPTGKVVDLGTRFSLSIDDTFQTHVTVVEGEAEVHSLNETHMEKLIQGETAVLGASQEKEHVKSSSSQVAYVSRLPDRVVNYTATPGPDGNAENIDSITMQRDGKIVTYQAQELICPSTTGFKLGKLENDSRVPMSLTRADSAAGVQPQFGPNDLSLCHGWINPPYSTPLPQKYEPGHNVGVQLSFAEPLVNGPGPELVVFDLHLIAHPPEGDPFVVTPADGMPHLHPFMVSRYDLDLTSENAKRITNFRLLWYSGPDVKEHGPLPIPKMGIIDPIPAKALAVSIDLSDLGYKPGESANRLIIQDAGDDENRVDPVVIVALPKLQVK